MSPTSLAIARATGQWSGPDPSQQQMLSSSIFGSGQQSGYNSYDGGGSFPGMGIGMGMGGMGMNGQGFVAPHINPRFAAMNMGLGMGMGGFDFQPQMNYQHLFAQQMQGAYVQSNQSQGTIIEMDASEQSNYIGNVEGEGDS